MFLKSVTEQSRQECSKLRPDADGNQNDNVADDIRCSAFEDIDNRHVIDLVAGVEAHADRRCNKTDCKTGNHHGAKLQCREAIVLHDRQHDRRQQKNCRADINKRTDDQDQNVKHKRDPDTGNVHAEEEVRHIIRHFLNGQNPGKYLGKPDDDHDGRGRNKCLLKCIPDVFPCQYLGILLVSVNLCQSAAYCMDSARHRRTQSLLHALGPSPAYSFLFGGPPGGSRAADGP